MHLSLDQVNSASLLVLFAIGETGLLYAPNVVEFQVFDVTSGSEVLRFPGGGREDVTDFATSKGVFPAWDTAMDVGMTPTAGGGFVTGLHRIRWYWTSEDGLTELTWSQDFYIETADLSVGYRTYVAPAEVRAEGVTVATLPNSRLLALMRKIQQYIERQTRQPFRPVQESQRRDGQNSDTLFFSIPILGIESIKINSSDLELDVDFYRVYNAPTNRVDPGWASEDHRANPKISLRAEEHLLSLFTETGSKVFDPGLMVTGMQNIAVKGIFGYVEPDGTTPDLIKEAFIRLVIANSPTLSTPPSGGMGVVGPVLRQRTDRHEVEFATLTPDAGNFSSALASSPQVEEILRMYRAPISLGSPAPRWVF